MKDANVADQSLAKGFFTPISNANPFLKMALEGFAGAGKSFTAAKIAAGLKEKIGSTKPIVIFDTEDSAVFLKTIVGEDAIVKPSRSLADLKETMRFMRDGLADILIIDSISHIWEDFLEAFKNKPLQYGKSAKTRLEFADWGILKPAWKKEFSEAFVTAPLHIIMTGRAGYEYENEINPDTQKREIYKSGIKMKVEGETAYEPHFLLLMEQIQEITGDKKSVYNQATVIKDRSDLFQGKTFKDPDYSTFAPMIEAILSQKMMAPKPAERDAAALFKTEEDKAEFKIRKGILLEEIEGYLVSLWPGQTAENKQLKSESIFYGFGTRSWMAVEQMGVSELEKGFALVQQFAKKVIAEKERGPLAEKPLGKGDAGAVEALGKAGKKEK